MAKRDDANSMHDLLGGGVKPLKQDKIMPFRRPIAPIARQRQLDDQRVMEELLEQSDETTSFESGDELKFLRTGYSTRLLKKLRRGDFSIQDELDLHGLVVADAKRETHEFINDCARDRVRAIRIIHGKGRNSAGRTPVLKNMLLGWLKRNQHVLAVCSTPANDGGTGAVYVLLNNPRR